MVKGRLNEAKQVYMGGAELSGSVELNEGVGPAFGITPVVHAGSVGGSDHVSFLIKKNISVLGIHTGGHPQTIPLRIAVDLLLKVRNQVCEYIFRRYYESGFNSLCYEIYSPRGIEINFRSFTLQNHKLC